MNPVTELRAFVRAALVDPVPRDHTEPDCGLPPAPGRRRRHPARRGRACSPGRCASSPATRRSTSRPSPSPAVWAVRGLRCPARCTWAGATPATGKDSSRAVVQSLALGALLLGLFMVGAVVVAQIPFLRDPVQELLDHARFGSLALVTVITIVNGIAEELYFRGALYAAVGRRHAVAVTTVVYTLVTATSGIPLLILAAALVGLVVAFQRRVTGGILGPIDHPPHLVAGHALPAAPGPRPAVVRGRR